MNYVLFNLSIFSGGCDKVLKSNYSVLKAFFTFRDATSLFRSIKAVKTLKIDSTLIPSAARCLKPLINSFTLGVALYYIHILLLFGSEPPFLIQTLCWADR